MSITKGSPEDVFRWADGTTCTREEWDRGEMRHMSDDFEVITEGSPEYEALHHGNVERRNFGCPQRGTGIYARPAARSLGTGEGDAWVP